MVKQVFHVTDMYCPNFGMRLEGLEDDLPGVQRVRPSYGYDETTVSASQIVAAIQKLGYTVVAEDAAARR